MALDFMEVPVADPRRSREGLYGSYCFGPAGKQIKVLLIDGRYFSTGPNAKEPDLLGHAQREWLEGELTDSEAQVHLIVSGIQVLSSEHKYEKWANFAKDRQWLFNIIVNAQVPGAIVLSGDRHIHELSVLEIEGLNYPLVDITSSGMTHSWERFQGEPNRYRKGNTYTGIGFGLLEFDWQESEVIVNAMLRNDDNETVNQTTIIFPN